MILLHEDRGDVVYINAEAVAFMSPVAIHGLPAKRRGTWLVFNNDRSLSVLESVEQVAGLILAAQGRALSEPTFPGIKTNAYEA